MGGGIESAICFSFAHIIIGIVLISSVYSQGCSNGYTTFELVTGYVYTAPDDTVELLPGTLQLTECLSQCRLNTSCQSVNFETGLCVLFSSSANQRPGALTASQFPVFTIYAHKICLTGRQRCDRDWMFERVSGYELVDRARKRMLVKSLEECMELCLAEGEFECRSANYHHSSKECFLSDMDRHTIPGRRYFAPSAETVDYLENNCVDQPVRLCEFRKVSAKILKTVDAVFQDVTSLDECRKKCLSVNYRCHSFDFGDPANSVCRISHLAAASLTHIQEPYLEIPGAATYEIASCYNVTIQCRSREMVARVKTSKLFNGKVYVKSRPNSCVTDVANSLEFEIKMAYHDLNCDVKQGGSSQFSNDIVIQHHDMIVTNQDLGVSVHCQYDLSNKSIAHGVRLDVNGEVDTSGTKAATVGPPNVTMKIVNRLGKDVLTAQVGDPLSLKFEIADRNSPYEIFVRELIAMDGIDSSEILLIDSLGCPTDAAIMGALSKSGNDGKVLHTPFDAFKFPTSEVVQFKALVTPCLPSCEPAQCTLRSYEGGHRRLDSLGRRKREVQSRSLRSRRETEEEEDLIVIQTIRITDKFGFDRAERKISNTESSSSADFTRIPSDMISEPQNCVNMIGLIVACSLFLLTQLVILIGWTCVWQKRKKNKFKKGSGHGVDMLYSNRRDSRLPENYSYDNPLESPIYDIMCNIPRPSSRQY